MQVLEEAVMAERHSASVSCHRDVVVVRMPVFEDTIDVSRQRSVVARVWRVSLVVIVVHRDHAIDGMSQDAEGVLCGWLRVRGVCAVLVRWGSISTRREYLLAEQ